MVSTKKKILSSTIYNKKNFSLSTAYKKGIHCIFDQINGLVWVWRLGHFSVMLACYLYLHWSNTSSYCHVQICWTFPSDLELDELYHYSNWQLIDTNTLAVVIWSSSFKIKLKGNLHKYSVSFSLRKGKQNRSLQAVLRAKANLHWN